MFSCKGNEVRILSKILGSGEFVCRIRKEYDKLYDKYMAMSNHITELRKLIKDSNLAKTDEERKELEVQVAVLSKTRRTLMNQQVLEFMTNAGLLPNYAFPESGVTLDATIIHRPPLDDKSAKCKIEEISIQRSASLLHLESLPLAIIFMHRNIA